MDALGNATNAEKQADLFSIIGGQHTSKDTMFSEPSLLKRKAISHLEINDTQTRELIKRVALDDAEDPSVRASAIGRLTANGFPEATNILLTLLGTLNANDAVMVAAVEDSLLTAPTPNILQALRIKAEGLSDPQLRSFMIKRLEKVAKGTTQ